MKFDTRTDAEKQQSRDLLAKAQFNAVKVGEAVYSEDEDEDEESEGNESDLQEVMLPVCWIKALEKSAIKQGRSVDAIILEALERLYA